MPVGTLAMLDIMEYSESKNVELPFFFNNGKYRLFGVLHSPTDRYSNMGFVFCYPFAPEVYYCRHIYTRFARRLACIGHHVLRFDYMGTGDSEGDFEDATVETHVSDVIAAIDVLRNKAEVDLVGIVGMRLGATWAGLAAINPETKLEPLVLWEPILDVRKFLHDSLRKSLSFQSVLFREIIFSRTQIIEKLLSDGEVKHQSYYLNSVDGYIIGRDFYLQSLDVDFLNKIRDYHGKTLVVHMNTNSRTLKSEVVDQLSSHKANGREVELIQVSESIPWWMPGGKGDKRISEPDQLFNITEDWLQRVI